MLNELQVIDENIWWGQKLSYDLYTTLTSSEEVTFEVVRKSDSTILDSWKLNTDSNGDILGNTYEINKTKLQSEGIFTLKASYNSVEYTDDFTVAYTAYLIDYYIYSQIREFMEIPVYNDVGIPNFNRKEFVFAYQNWIRSPIPQFIYQSSDTVNTSLAKDIDYSNGRILLLNAFPDTDELESNYSFAFFTEIDIANTIELVLNELNMQKPATDYTINTAPREWDNAIANGVLYYLLRRLYLALSLRNYAVIFENPSEIRNSVYNLITGYQTTFSETKKMSKRRGFIAPRAIVSGTELVPHKVDATNWRVYTRGRML